MDDSHFATATGHAFRLAGYEPRIVHGVIDTAATLVLVAAGSAATLTTPMMVRVRPGDDVRVHPMHAAPTRELILIHRSAHVRPTVAAAMALITDASRT